MYVYVLFHVHYIGWYLLQNQAYINKAQMGFFSSYFFHLCMTGFEQNPISEKLSKKF